MTHQRRVQQRTLKHRAKSNRCRKLANYARNANGGGASIPNIPRELASPLAQFARRAVQMATFKARETDKKQPEVKKHITTRRGN